MIIVALTGLAVLAVALSGGRLSRLAELRLRLLWLPMVAVAAQVVLTVVAPTGNDTLHRGLYVATYVLIAAFLWANRRVAGLWVIALGTSLNTLAIIANGGVMPASATAQRLSRVRLRAGFDNSAHVVGAHLAWLGDVIPWPGPLHNVLSIGDLLIVAGIVVTLHLACRQPGPAADVRGAAHAG